MLVQTSAAPAARAAGACARADADVTAAPKTAPLALPASAGRLSALAVDPSSGVAFAATFGDGKGGASQLRAVHPCNMSAVAGRRRPHALRAGFEGILAVEAEVGALFVLPTPRLLVAAAGRTSAGLLVQFRIEADGSLARVQALGQPDLKAGDLARRDGVALGRRADGDGDDAAAVRRRARRAARLVAINPITLRALRRWKRPRGDGDGGVGVALPNGDLIVGTAAGDGAALVRRGSTTRGRRWRAAPRCASETSHVTCGFSDPLGKYAYFASAASPALFARASTPPSAPARALKASLTLDAADGPVTSCAFDAHRQIAYLGMGGAAGRIVAVDVAAMARLPGGGARAGLRRRRRPPRRPSASGDGRAARRGVDDADAAARRHTLTPRRRPRRAARRSSSASTTRRCAATAAPTARARAARARARPAGRGPSARWGPRAPPAARATASAPAGVCRCDAGWGGKDCSEAACPGGAGGCSGHGVCKGAGQCECFDGWGGADCAAPLCAHNCSSHGSCAAPGACKCDAAGRGDCATPACPRAPAATARREGVPAPSAAASRSSPASPTSARASRAGRAPTARRRSAPPAAPGRGRCESPGRCRCQPGWTGPECTQLACPAVGGCLHGTCVAGGANATAGADALGRRCACDPGWSGAALLAPRVPGDVPRRVHRRGGVCSTPYLRGDDCTQPYCGASACSGHGHCALSPTRAPLSRQPASPMCVCKPAGRASTARRRSVPTAAAATAVRAPRRVPLRRRVGRRALPARRVRGVLLGHGECVGGKSERRCMCASGWRDGSSCALPVCPRRAALRSPALRDASFLSHTKDMHVRYDERSKTLGLAYYTEATPTGHVAPVTAAPATADKMAFPALLQTSSSAVVAGPAAKRRAMLMTALASAAGAALECSGHGKCARAGAPLVRPRLERRRLLERLQRDVRPRRLRRPELRVRARVARRDVRGERACPANCSYPHGECNGATLGCQCKPFFYGRDCSVGDGSTARRCHLDGRCDAATMQCLMGWAGADCERASCLNDCSGHGHCAAPGVCKCAPGWGGIDCAKRACNGRATAPVPCAASTARGTRAACARPAGAAPTLDAAVHGVVLGARPLRRAGVVRVRGGVGRPRLLARPPAAPTARCRARRTAATATAPASTARACASRGTAGRRASRAARASARATGGARRRGSARAPAAGRAPTARSRTAPAAARAAGGARRPACATASPGGAATTARRPTARRAARTTASAPRTPRAGSARRRSARATRAGRAPRATARCARRRAPPTASASRRASECHDGWEGRDCATPSCPRADASTVGARRRRQAAAAALAAASRARRRAASSAIATRRRWRRAARRRRARPRAAAVAGADGGADEPGVLGPRRLREARRVRLLRRLARRRVRGRRLPAGVRRPRRVPRQRLRRRALRVRARASGAACTEAVCAGGCVHGKCAPSRGSASASTAGLAPTARRRCAPSRSGRGTCVARGSASATRAVDGAGGVGRRHGRAHAAVCRPGAAAARRRRRRRRRRRAVVWGGAACEERVCPGSPSARRAASATTACARATAAGTTAATARTRSASTLQRAAGRVRARGPGEGSACVCAPGWIGSCGEPLCTNNCSGHGVCSAPFSCECEPGYQGESQRIVLPQRQRVHRRPRPLRRPRHVPVRAGLGRRRLRRRDVPRELQLPRPADQGGVPRRVPRERAVRVRARLARPRLRHPVLRAARGAATAPAACASARTGGRARHCSQGVCPLNCSGHGACDGDTGTCACAEGYSGKGCEVVRCKGCNGKGRCVRPDVCACDAGWGGCQCDTPVCPADCGKLAGRGKCVGPNRCACAAAGRAAPRCRGATARCGRALAAPAATARAADGAGARRVRVRVGVGGRRLPEAQLRRRLPRPRHLRRARRVRLPRAVGRRLVHRCLPPSAPPGTPAAPARPFATKCETCDKLIQAHSTCRASSPGRPGCRSTARATRGGAASTHACRQWPPAARRRTAGCVLPGVCACDPGWRGAVVLGVVAVHRAARTRCSGHATAFDGVACVCEAGSARRDVRAQGEPRPTSASIYGGAGHGLRRRVLPVRHELDGAGGWRRGGAPTELSATARRPRRRVLRRLRGAPLARARPNALLGPLALRGGADTRNGATATPAGRASTARSACPGDCTGRGYCYNGTCLCQLPGGAATRASDRRVPADQGARRVRQRAQARRRGGSSGGTQHRRRRRGGGDRARRVGGGRGGGGGPPPPSAGARAVRRGRHRRRLRQRLPRRLGRPRLRDADVRMQNAAVLGPRPLRARRDDGRRVRVPPRLERRRLLEARVPRRPRRRSSRRARRRGLRRREGGRGAAAPAGRATAPSGELRAQLRRARQLLRGRRPPERLRPRLVGRRVRAPSASAPSPAPRARAPSSRRTRRRRARRTGCACGGATAPATSAAATPAGAAPTA